MAQVTINHRLGIVAAAAVLLAVGAPRPAIAQSGSAGSEINTKKVTLNLENADIRYGLKLLFQAAGANYSIDQNVQGAVSVSLNDVSFRVALESLLKSASTPLTYRVEEGVYLIAPKREDRTLIDRDEEEIIPKTSGPKPVYKIRLNFIDAIDLANAFGGGVLESRFGTMGSQGFGGGMGNGGFGNSGFGNNGMGNSGFGNNNFGSGNSGFGSFGNNGFGNGFSGNSGMGSGFRGNGGNGVSGGNGGGVRR
jgi:hypothetical protein